MVCIRCSVCNEVVKELPGDAEENADVRRRECYSKWGETMRKKDDEGRVEVEEEVEE
jgi:hypothetical protein